MATGTITNTDKVVNISSQFTIDTTKAIINVCDFWKSGKVCSFYLSPKYVNVSTSSGFVTIGTIASGYRPKEDFTLTIPCVSDGMKNNLFKIKKTGEVQIAPSTSIDGWTDYITATYVCV